MSDLYNIIRAEAEKQLFADADVKKMVAKAMPQLKKAFNSQFNQCISDMDFTDDIYDALNDGGLNEKINRMVKGMVQAL